MLPAKETEGKRVVIDGITYYVRDVLTSMGNMVRLELKDESGQRSFVDLVEDEEVEVQ